MNKYLGITVLLCCALFGHQPAQAADAIKWKTVGDWTISVDTSLGYKCFLSAVYERGTILRFGLAAGKSSVAYMLLGDMNWKSIESGKQYPLTVKFDDRPGWTGDATGLRLSGGFTVLYLKIDQPRFFAEFARRRGLYVEYEGKQVANLSLRGSFRGVAELIKCQQAINLSTGTPASTSRDPFASSGPARQVSDPFAD